MTGGQTFTMLLVVALAGALLPLLSSGGTLRIALLANAEASGDAIFLGSLLPDSASQELRSTANKILLGVTPQYGTLRFLRGSAVGAAIDRAGLGAVRFSIPDVITVRRAGRDLQVREVAEALAAGTGKFSLPPATELALRRLRPEDLTWESAVRVAPGEAQLTVTGITVDAAAALAQFRIRVEGDHHSLPFEVTARLAPGASAANFRNVTAVNEHELPRARRTLADRATGIHEPVPQDTDLPLLVGAGRIAQLHLHSENSSMLLEVKALQPGHLGEIIRVRLPRNGKTLQAKVVGEQAVDAAF